MKKYTKTILVSLVIAIIANISIILGYTYDIFTITNKATLYETPQVFSLLYQPNDIDELYDIDMYLKENSSYIGYYPSTGSIDCVVDNINLRGFLINEMLEDFLGNCIIEGQNLSFDNQEKIQVIVGGKAFEDKDIGSIIDIEMKGNNNIIQKQAVIAGRIDAREVMREYRNYNLDDVLEQKNGIIIIPDLNYSDILIENKNSEIIINFAFNDVYEVGAFLSDKGQIKDPNNLALTNQENILITLKSLYNPFIPFTIVSVILMLIICFFESKKKPTLSNMLLSTGSYLIFFFAIFMPLLINAIRLNVQDILLNYLYSLIPYLAAIIIAFAINMLTNKDTLIKGVDENDKI